LPFRNERDVIPAYRRHQILAEDEAAYSAYPSRKTGAVGSLIGAPCRLWGKRIAGIGSLIVEAVETA